MKIALTNCRLIDVLAGAASTGNAVIIDGQRIRSVTSEVAPEIPADARVIDLAGRSLLPGLIDLHLHLTWYYHRPDVTVVGKSTYNDPRIAFVGAWNMGQLLDAGITTVRDLGSCGHLVFDLKWALGEGLIRGPRVLAAGRLIVPTGGHATVHPGISYEVNGIAEARRAVREEIKAGADLIKLACLQDEWDPQELHAAVDQAHRMGKKVACHVNFPPSIRNALDAGVDSIEHGCLVSDEELDRMREGGVFWVITSRIYAEQFRDFKAQVANPETPAHVRAAAEKQVRRHEWIWDNMPRAARRAAEMGVKIGAGSDMLYPEIGIAALPLELESMVGMGLTPAQALWTATSSAAECIGLQDDLGTVEAGKLADLIVVDGDPLTDITAVQQLALVIKDGKIERSVLAGE